jgi:hypothetical protein
MEVDMDEFGSQWMQRWQSCVNADGVMKNVGRYFDEDLLLDFGDDKAYVVRFRGGRVDKIVDKPGPEDRYAFALRAPKSSWQKFVQRTPPPMYNDIWAMAHPLHGRLKIEGDVKVVWQNLRAFTWALALMRDVH